MRWKEFLCVPRLHEKLFESLLQTRWSVVYIDYQLQDLFPPYSQYSQLSDLCYESQHCVIRELILH